MGIIKGGGSLSRHGCSGFGRAFCAAPKALREGGGEGRGKVGRGQPAGPAPSSLWQPRKAAGGERAGANGGRRGRVTGGAAATPAGRSGRGAGTVAQQQHPRG